MEFLFAVLIGVLTVIPFLTLLPHFGIEKYWAFTAIIPLAALVLLWVMASKLREMEER